MINLAVVTGGKSHDVWGFHRLFRDLDGVEAVIQHMDDFASSPEDVRISYDGVLFYIMYPGAPIDEGLPGYCGKPRSALQDLISGDQGILLLHHAILAYPDWPLWNGLAGIADRKLRQYSHDEDVSVKVSQRDHPLTAGLEDWTMTDETYDLDPPGPDSRLLLTTDHRLNSPAIAWTRERGKGRTFCFQSGHDSQTWEHPRFREVLLRGIRWICRAP